MYNLFIVVSDAKTLSKFKPDRVPSGTELSADTYDKIIIRRKKNKLKWTAVLGFIAAILSVTVVLLVKKYRRGI